jgi:hypothetical protein
MVIIVVEIVVKIVKQVVVNNIILIDGDWKLNKMAFISKLLLIMKKKLY